MHCHPIFEGRILMNGTTKLDALPSLPKTMMNPCSTLTSSHANTEDIEFVHVLRTQQSLWCFQFIICIHPKQVVCIWVSIDLLNELVACLTKIPQLPISRCVLFRCICVY